MLGQCNQSFPWAGQTAMGIDAPDWVALTQHVQVSDLGRELALYLGLGYDVHSAADGWALLKCGERSFVLVQASLPAASPAPSSMHLTVVDPVVWGPGELVENQGPAAVPVGPGPSVEWAS